MARRCRGFGTTRILTDSPMTSAQISDWYELVSGPSLEQGEYSESCPVFRPPPDLDWQGSGEIPEFGEIGVSLLDVVVVSQSCDIADNQKSDMWLVVLCPVWKLSAIGQTTPYLNSTFGKEECRRGNLPGYHMISGCDNQNCRREISVVSFRELWSLPLNFVRKFAASHGLRRRIRSPYKEHLSQSLARYFMRVGLPCEVPKFTTSDSKNENEAIKALKKLDESTLSRVLASFRPPFPPSIESQRALSRIQKVIQWFRKRFTQ